MKIGIITFYQFYNYGALLQAYALEQFVKGLDKDFEVELINFKNTQNGSILGIPFDKIRNLPQFFKSIVAKLVDIPFKLPKKINFDRFRKKFMNIAYKKYRKYDQLKNNPPQYDVYICGSDQIWNPEIQPKAKPAFFLKFVSDKSVKKISYAASIGVSQIEDKYLDEYKDFLSSIDNISVREQTGVKALQNLTTKEIARNIDPTLLLTDKEWSEISANIKVKEKYILVYMLGYKKEVVDLVNHISHELNLKVVHFGPYKTYENEIGRFHCKGPDVFVSLFQNAEFVVTNSFHGTAFSIVFNKKFYSVISSKVGSRISDLLGILGLEDRIVGSINDIGDPNRDIYYERVMEILEHEKSKSKSYLLEAILGSGAEVQNEG